MFFFFLNVILCYFVVVFYLFCIFMHIMFFLFFEFFVLYFYSKLMSPSAIVSVL